VADYRDITRSRCKPVRRILIKPSGAGQSYYGTRLPHAWSRSQRVRTPTSSRRRFRYVNPCRSCYPFDFVRRLLAAVSSKAAETRTVASQQLSGLRRSAALRSLSLPICITSCCCDNASQLLQPLLDGSVSSLSPHRRQVVNAHSVITAGHMMIPVSSLTVRPLGRSSLLVCALAAVWAPTIRSLAADRMMLGQEWSERGRCAQAGATN
jgi:hypothetical protein